MEFWEMETSAILNIESRARGMAVLKLLPCKHEERPDFGSPEPMFCQVSVLAWESKDEISRSSWLASVKVCI